ncbi:MAG TPA: type III pantothenate kinase, partial [Clostridia bacterium]|nr:type III pantothenate kinase [Clostridia bacterium]
MDIGNTNIKTAVFEGRELIKSWRISTNTSY